MTKVDLQYDLLNYTPANAAPPEANFNRIEQHINQELVERDGTVAMRGQLKLVGDPLAELDAAPKQYVDAVMPVGIIMMFGGAGSPPGGKWAICNGAELETSTYPELFAVIGNAYSPGGTPAGRFHLPPLSNRMPLGAGTAAVGTTGGQANAPIVNHAHPVPSHTHGMGSHSHGLNLNTGIGGADHTHGFSGSTGGQSNQHQHFGPGTTASLLASVDTGQGVYIGCPGGGIGGLFNAYTGDYGADHHHAFSGTTGGISANHVHLVSGNTGGPSTNTTDGTALTTSAPTGGVDVANANLPPYVAVQYIIRCK